MYETTKLWRSAHVLNIYHHQAKYTGVIVLDIVVNKIHFLVCFVTIYMMNHS